MNDRSTPPVTPQLRAEAAKRPGEWVYVIDPFFPDGGSVPPFGIEGAWKVDDNGNLTGEFQRNPKYRPSPPRLGMPAPRDAVEAALQLAAAGYGPESSIATALMTADVYIPGDGTAKTDVYTDADGEFVPVFTSRDYAPASYPSLEKVPFRILLARLHRNLALAINPGTKVSVRISVATLVDEQDES